MKIFVLGTRGFPNVQGGVEKHCEELYPRLVSLGFDITVTTRTPYIRKDQRLKSWKGVRFKHIWCPHVKSLEAIIHTFLVLLSAVIDRPRIIHFHTIGPALLIPFARLLGFRVVMTHHGADYKRQKWGPTAKRVLALGEYVGVKYANATIVISQAIKTNLEERFPRSSLYLIGNGINTPARVESGSTLVRFGLHPRAYVFTACRLVPEKGLHDLVTAYSGIHNPSFQLVIAGEADHETSYSRSLKSDAKAAGVILTGNIFGIELAELYSNAALFVLPSYHEGFPIALLEALSYSLPVLVSDIPPHKGFPLSEQRYFVPGDITGLREQMKRLIDEGTSATESDTYERILVDKYNWDVIAKETASVYWELSGQVVSA